MSDYDTKKLIISLFKAYLASNHQVIKPDHLIGTIPADVVKSFLENSDSKSILSDVLNRLTRDEKNSLNTKINRALSYSETDIASAKATLKEKQEVLDGLMAEWNNPAKMEHREHDSFKQARKASSWRDDQLFYAASHADKDLYKKLEVEISNLYYFDPINNCMQAKANWNVDSKIVNSRILLAVEIKTAKMDVKNAEDHLNQLMDLQRFANLGSQDEAIQYQALSVNGQSCYDDAKQMLLGLATDHSFLYPVYFDLLAQYYPNETVVKTQRSLQIKQTELVRMIDNMIQPLSASATLFVSSSITNEKRKALIDLKNQIEQVDTYTANPSVFEEIYHRWTTSRTRGNSKTNQELMSSHRHLLSRVIAMFRTVRTASDAILTQAGFFSLSERVESYNNDDGAYYQRSEKGFSY